MKKISIVLLIILMAFILMACDLENHYIDDSTQFDLTIEVEGEGTVSFGEEEKQSYPKNTIVDVIAKANSGYEFIGWEGDIESKEKEISIFMNDNKKIKAIFTQDEEIINDFVKVYSGSTSEDNGEISLDYNIEVTKYPVTFDEFLSYSYDTREEIPYDQGWGKGDRPIINVSIVDAMKYLNWLSEKEGLIPAYDIETRELVDSVENVEGYRLPTSTEWLYVAKGGKEGLATKYAGSDNLDEVGWYWENSNGKTQPVGRKAANELGIYELSGNVLEWTNDKDKDNAFYLYGGSWYYDEELCEIDLAYKR
ncbi:MAG: SUMF1/EgtB/PvdO family nonheme iron enzyme, partial [archaeon]